MAHPTPTPSPARGGEPVTTPIKGVLHAGMCRDAILRVSLLLNVSLFLRLSNKNIPTFFALPQKNTNFATNIGHYAMPTPKRPINK